MTKVKICGITNLNDAILSAELGADALGFNFYGDSPRFISLVLAKDITRRLPKSVMKVGVFVNETIEKIIETVSIAGLDAVQLHGDESPKFIADLKLQTDCDLIKAFRVSESFVPEEICDYDADAILLDAFSPDRHGGTGETFDWEVARRVSDLTNKLYLAGGLSELNVRQAITAVDPFAVDACSRLESTPGIKDGKKLRRFMMEAKRND